VVSIARDSTVVRMAVSMMMMMVVMLLVVVAMTMCTCRNVLIQRLCLVVKRAEERIALMKPSVRILFRLSDSFFIAFSSFHIATVIVRQTVVFDEKREKVGS